MTTKMSSITRSSTYTRSLNTAPNVDTSSGITAMKNDPKTKIRINNMKQDGKGMIFISYI